MDFDKKARALTGGVLGCGGGPYDYGPCKDVTGPCVCSDRIAAALKAAYNEGLEDAALCCEQIARGEIGAMFSHVACAEEACAAAVRAKKVP